MNVALTPARDDYSCNIPIAPVIQVANTAVPLRDGGVAPSEHPALTHSAINRRVHLNQYLRALQPEGRHHALLAENGPSELFRLPLTRRTATPRRVLKLPLRPCARETHFD